MATVTARGVTTIALVGFMGAGKSSAAKLLAGELGLTDVDADAEIEKRLGASIDSYFETSGEAAFREVEEETVLGLLDKGGVIALGGGAVLSERVREALGDTLCIYLECDPHDAFERVQESARPLARDRHRFVELHEQRVPLYEAVAKLIVPAADGEVIRRALPAVIELARRGLPGGLKIVWATAESGDYPVLFGRGALESAASVWPGGRPFVVTDRHVGRRHLGPLSAALGELLDTCVLPPGEEHKRLVDVEEILRAMARSGARREDTVIALGGGVVGDIAGFCAAIYQRGVRMVQVPTTVVAQVDSAYGGKTGVDLPEAKNYVGAFHQPAAVIVDPRTLETLPEEEWAAGYAEVIKTGLIAGNPLWHRVMESPAGELPGDDLILGCARTKLEVVRADEWDHGRRAVLNLGHSVGHAIEAATGYERYRHGEAVGLGLLAALRLSEQTVGLDPRVRADVKELLDRWGMPTRIDTAPGEIIDHLRYDKKRTAEHENWVLLEAPGRPLSHHEVETGLVEAAIGELIEQGGNP